MSMLLKGLAILALLVTVAGACAVLYGCLLYTSRRWERRGRKPDAGMPGLNGHAAGRRHAGQTERGEYIHKRAAAARNFFLQQRGRGPVSYTHLDVYKRQQWAGAQGGLCGFGRDGRAVSGSSRRSADGLCHGRF